MAHRIFRDSSDLEWEAFEVHPMLSERRYVSDRRTRPRSSSERRQLAEERRSLPRSYLNGWLAFRAPGRDDQRRRLLPVPPSWDELDDRGLQQLLAQAAPSVRPRTRLTERMATATLH